MVNELEDLNPLERFTGRVENYNRYRPSYPVEILDLLAEYTGLQKAWTIADVGSGTGIFSKLLLEKGYHVWGVEPNSQMRDAAQEILKYYKNYISVNGRAEHTSLADHSIDLVTVAQAFHWMEPVATKLEFNRILKPGGSIALLWNTRLTNTNFLKAFEELKVKYGTDYQATRMISESDIIACFKPVPIIFQHAGHSQILDYNGLKGQLLSTSYMPLAGILHDQMLEELKIIFERYHENNCVRIEYDTKMFIIKP